jgi:SAM-dependent methyltransferase
MRFTRYDRIVSHYPDMWPLIVPGYVPILTGMLEMLRVWKEPPREILDLGCGPGSATSTVAPACDPAGKITLVDGSGEMLRAARESLGDSIRATIVGDFTEPQVAAKVYLPEAYDLALASFALHHIEDPLKRQVIDGLGSSVKRGGLLFLADEVVSDRPAGWEVVERVRGRIIQEHQRAGRITREFWDLENTLAEADRLPFLPARTDDLTSWLARAGFAVSCPLNILGSALLVAVKAS